MGKDKSTIKEKLEFIDVNVELITAIAKDPLAHREWLDLEDCWQALSTIFELSDAFKTPNPEEFVSHIHVHQDGSCNGLQHYAALGRDSEGAYQVNLGATERPGDVYTHVANMVIEMVKKDIETPSSENCEMAKKVVGHIKRKTIKQTVMTSVYGVTFVGAKEQINRQLRDQKFRDGNHEEMARASSYLAKYTLQAISNLFLSAHKIKKWFILCSRIISKEGNPVSWITPMGVPVVQPYRQLTNMDEVSSIIQILKLTKNNENVIVSLP
jgi:DNA-directed RNA polymerase